MATLNKTRLENRLRLVEEHVRAESAHDLRGTMKTLGDSPHYEINGQPLSGHEGIEKFYSEHMEGFPDFYIDVRQQHVSDEAIIVECYFRGTHKATWRGIAATGRRCEFPVCAIFRFDDKEMIAGKTLYFDSALLLTQLGLMPASA